MNDRFKIQKVIRYRNSFLPIINGTFTPEEDETLIDVRVVTSPLVTACFVILSSGVVIGIGMAVFSFFHSGVADERFFFLSFLLLFLYLLICFRYGSEAERSKAMLERIFLRPTLENKH